MSSGQIGLLEVLVRASLARVVSALLGPLARGAAWLSRRVRVADDIGVRGDGLPCPGAGSRAFEFRILGPVQAVRDGRELALGGPKRRAVLALLLAAEGRVVPAERLAEDLWGASPPPGAAGTLRSHLSRLRTLVGRDAALIARGGG